MIFSGYKLLQLSNLIIYFQQEIYDLKITDIGNFSESVTVSSDPAATNPLIRGTQLKITCKYTTLNFQPNSLKWMQNGNEFTSTQKGSLSAGTAEGALSVSIYTVAAIAVSDSGSYTCSAQYADGGATPTVTSPTPVALTVLGKIYLSFTYSLTYALSHI